MADIVGANARYTPTDFSAPTSEGVQLDGYRISVGLGARKALILVFGQGQTGASTTSMTQRVRRGDTATAPLVGEGNAENLKAAAGNRESWLLVVSDQVERFGAVDYFTSWQAAGANIAMDARCVLVLAIG